MIRQYNKYIDQRLKYIYQGLYHRRNIIKIENINIEDI